MSFGLLPSRFLGCNLRICLLFGFRGSRICLTLGLGGIGASARIWLASLLLLLRLGRPLLLLALEPSLQPLRRCSFSFSMRATS